MLQVKFLIGSENRFFQFISSLDEKDKIALISHTDLDGLASAKIVNKVINADKIIFINYEFDNSLIEILQKEKITKIIITDMLIEDKEFLRKLESFAEILIIDHHQIKEDFNSEKITIINAQGYCAAYLCYYLFSKIQNIEKLDWLVACACISDLTIIETKEFLKRTMKKYNDKLEIKNSMIKKSGLFWELQLKISLGIIYQKENLKKAFNELGENFGEIGELEIHAKEINDEIKNAIQNFYKEKKEINGRIFWEFSPKYQIGSIVINTISSEIKNKTIIVARQKENKYHFSARRQDKKEDMNLLLKKLISGFENSSAGGHILAAGGHIMLKDKEIFLERLKKI